MFPPPPPPAGLTPTEASDLSNYFHFRAPSGAKKAVLASPGVVGPTDFLDSLGEDTPLPTAVWALTVDKARGAAHLKSLVYPGYYFYHATGSSRFGGAYFGDGAVNEDIGFMV